MPCRSYENKSTKRILLIFETVREVIQENRHDENIMISLILICVKINYN